LKYFIRDRILQKPYKEIRFFGEFQQELLYVLPFAYWHYKNGTLKRTISSLHTKDLYFFSPDHREEFKTRRWLGNYTLEFPHGPHAFRISEMRWKQVPLKSYYRNDRFVYDKPLLILANRYNSEWDEPPKSFFSLEILEVLINKLKSKYQIIYNRPTAGQIVNDNSKILTLNDYKWMRKNHPEVKLLQDIYKQKIVKVNGFNHLQLMVYANADHFISVHGGTAALASYFGGKNVIYSQKGFEHPLDEFKNVFPKLSGTKIYLCRTESELISSVSREFL